MGLILDIAFSMLVFCAVFVLAFRLLLPGGVSLTDEFKLKYAPEGKGKRFLYLVGGGLGCAAAAFGVTGQVHLAFFALPGGIFVARSMDKKKQKERKELLRSQYAQTLGILASALQGGLSPYQAMEDAVPSMPRPARDVFVEILRRTRTGSTFVQAVESVAKETGWSDLKSLVIALKIYSSTGYNLVEVFKHLLETVYERENDRRYTNAVTSETRMTASMLSFLPFFLMGAARVAAPQFTEPLFATLAGNAVVGLCVVMVLLGNYLVGRMVEKVVS